MTNNKTLSDLELDDLFASAATSDPQPSAALLSRVMTDAEATDEARIAREQVPAEPRKSGGLSGILAAIGGWPAMAGLATATIAGIWIGFAPPQSLDGIGEEYLSSSTDYDLGDLMPTISAFLVEG